MGIHVTLKYLNQFLVGVWVCLFIPARNWSCHSVLYINAQRILPNIEST